MKGVVTRGTLRPITSIMDAGNHNVWDSAWTVADEEDGKAANQEESDILSAANGDPMTLDYDDSTPVAPLKQVSSLGVTELLDSNAWSRADTGSSELVQRGLKGVWDDASSASLNKKKTTDSDEQIAGDDIQNEWSHNEVHPSAMEVDKEVLSSSTSEPEVQLNSPEVIETALSGSSKAQTEISSNDSIQHTDIDTTKVAVLEAEVGTGKTTEDEEECLESEDEIEPATAKPGSKTSEVDDKIVETPQDDDEFGDFDDSKDAPVISTKFQLSKPINEILEANITYKSTSALPVSDNLESILNIGSARKWTNYLTRPTRQFLHVEDRPESLTRWHVSEIEKETGIILTHWKEQDLRKPRFGFKFQWKPTHKNHPSIKSNASTISQDVKSLASVTISQTGSPASSSPAPSIHASLTDQTASPSSAHHDTTSLHSDTDKIAESIVNQMEHVQLDTDEDAHVSMPDPVQTSTSTSVKPTESSTEDLEFPVPEVDSTQTSIKDSTQMQHQPLPKPIEKLELSSSQGLPSNPTKTEPPSRSFQLDAPQISAPLEEEFDEWGDFITTEEPATTEKPPIPQKQDIPASNTPFAFSIIPLAPSRSGTASPAHSIKSIKPETAEHSFKVPEPHVTPFAVSSIPLVPSRSPSVNSIKQTKVETVEQSLNGTRPISPTLGLLNRTPLTHSSTDLHSSHVISPPRSNSSTPLSFVSNAGSARLNMLDNVMMPTPISKTTAPSILTSSSRPDKADDFDDFADFVSATPPLESASPMPEPPATVNHTPSAETLTADAAQNRVVLGPLQPSAKSKQMLEDETISRIVDNLPDLTFLL